MLKRLVFFGCFVVMGWLPPAFSEQPAPLQRANNEELSAGMGHFARARSLLVAAINEFDAGLKVVNPEALLDVKGFRGSLLERAGELERVLDPQPRVSRAGVAYEPDSRLLGAPKGSKAEAKLK